MRKGVGSWMMGRRCPPLEDTGVFAADWRASPPPRSCAASRLIGWVTDTLRGDDRDPLGSTLRACPGVADFEMLSRLV